MHKHLFLETSDPLPPIVAQFSTEYTYTSGKLAGVITFRVETVSCHCQTSYFTEVNCENVSYIRNRFC